MGVAPAGCSINSGGTIQSLPVGFIGFKFTATFGDEPTTINVATVLSLEGFKFVASLDKLRVAGMNYSDLSLVVTITSNSSEVKFAGRMDSKMGDALVNSDFAVNSSGMSQTLELNLTNWAWGKKGSVNLKTFHFKTSSNIPTSGGCAEFKTKADGLLTIGSVTYRLNNAQFEVNCRGVTLLDLSVEFSHKIKWNGTTAKETFTLHYPYGFGSIGNKTLYGEATFAYSRPLSEKVAGRTFSANVKVSIDFQAWINTVKPQDSSFEFIGYFEAGRVSGDIDCTMDGFNNDFGCEGDVRYNPSWAGVYHKHWDLM